LGKGGISTGLRDKITRGKGKRENLQNMLPRRGQGSKKCPQWFLQAQGNCIDTGKNEAGKRKEKKRRTAVASKKRPTRPKPMPLERDKKTEKGGKTKNRRRSSSTD